MKRLNRRGVSLTFSIIQNLFKDVILTLIKLSVVYTFIILFSKFIILVVTSEVCKTRILFFSSLNIFLKTRLNKLQVLQYLVPLVTGSTILTFLVKRF